MAVVQPTKKKFRPVLAHQRWNQCMWRSHEGVEENGVSNQDRGLKVGLPSNSCGQETIVVSIGWV